ncbi:MAG: hypothetical protein LBK58_02060 [Prevotellaceae bacterium]|jgi:hypothetical protein|nr:hypothetical protein [Prevotellaceae bacterium]
MAKKELLTFPDFVTFSDTDKLFGYSTSAGSPGFFRGDSIMRGGYACRRWNTGYATPAGEAVGNIDYLRNLPGMLGLGCYLVDENHGRRKLDPTNHYKLTTGGTAALDGSMGDYMWGWVTPWYYAWWVEGSYFYEAVGLTPIPGKPNYKIPVASTSALGVSVIDRDAQKMVSVINTSARYRGLDNGTTAQSYDGTYRSLLGRAATNETCAKYGEYARNKGADWEGYWFGMHAAIGILTRIIFGNRNIQAAYNANKDANGLYQGGLGPGVTEYSGSNWDSHFAYYPFLPTSVGVELADGVGVVNFAVLNDSSTTLHTAKVPVFFGLKNFYGYLGRRGRGELISKIAGGAGEHYVCPSLYSPYSMSSLAGMIKANTVPATPTANTWTYISQMAMQNLAASPTVLNGTSATFYCDAFYNDNAASGLRVPYRGGSANDGAIAGLGCLSVYNAASAVNVNIGSPLCEANEDWSPVAFTVS